MYVLGTTQSLRITQQKIRKIISQTCELLRDKKIEIDDYINHPNFQSLNDAVIGIHQPDHKNPINDYLIGGESKARLRIGLEEIIANKISYLSIKEQNQNRPAEKFKNNTLATNIEENLYQILDNWAMIPSSAKISCQLRPLGATTKLFGFCCQG